MEHENNGDINYDKCTWNGPQRLGKGTGRVGNQRTNRDNPNKSITKIGQNTEKSSEDLRRLVVTQTPVKDHQLTLVWKTRKEYNNNNNWSKSALPIEMTHNFSQNQLSTKWLISFIAESLHVNNVNEKQDKNSRN